MTPRSLLLLDTNTASYIADGRSKAARLSLDRHAVESTIALSAISEGELLYGLAKRSQSARLRALTEELLSTFLILPWDSAAASTYATLRLRLTTQGKPLSAIDTLIAAHAISVNATLVTHDHAFSQVEELGPLLDWAIDL